MQRKGLRGYRLIILAAVGALLVIFGAVWMSVIFPALDKLPSDYDQTYSFDGTFSEINPATFELESFPVKQTLAQKAVGTRDGSLLVHEEYTVVNLDTGADISAVYGDVTTVALDQRTLEYQRDIDERARWGQWGPPRPLAEGDSYDLWHPGVRQPLTAQYLRSEDFQGLNVFVFQIEAQDVSIGDEPQYGLPLVMSSAITQWVEPSSGTVVSNESLTTTSIALFGELMPVQISELRFDEATTAGLMDTARSASWMLLWFRTLVPWLAIGFGGFLLVGSAATVAVRAWRKAGVDRPTEEPRPTYV
jgi:hypothetical protein